MVSVVVAVIYYVALRLFDEQRPDTERAMRSWIREHAHNEKKNDVLGCKMLVACKHVLNHCRKWNIKIDRKK